MGLIDTIRNLAGGGGVASGPAGETETVRKIVGRLDGLEPERARYVAAFAFVLGRVAHADRHVSDEETRAVEAIVRRVGHLSEPESVLVVEIAKAQHRLFGGTESFVVTRELREIATAAGVNSTPSRCAGTTSASVAAGTARLSTRR